MPCQFPHNINFAIIGEQTTRLLNTLDARKKVMQLGNAINFISNGAVCCAVTLTSTFFFYFFILLIPILGLYKNKVSFFF